LGDIHRWLRRARAGDEHARDRLQRQLHEELAQRIPRHAGGNRSDWREHQIASDLIGRIGGQAPIAGAERVYLFEHVARALRRVAVDRARGLRLIDRIDEATYELSSVPDERSPIDAEALDAALEELEQVAAYRRHARIVELELFVRSTAPEIAELLQISVDVVQRESRFARAWLRRRVAAKTS
jgi:hypothetical protein